MTPVIFDARCHSARPSRQASALPDLPAASKQLIASIAVCISLATWDDRLEPLPEVESLSIAIAKADTEGADVYSSRTNPVE